MGKIIVGKQAGFCFGVERALKIALESREKQKGPVYILGSLIHNPRVVSDLEKRGIKTIHDLNSAERGGVLLIRSHGAGPQIFKEAEKLGLKVIDATCPFVKQEQNLAKELLRDGYQVVVVGDPEHPEVQAVVESVSGCALVINPLNIELLNKEDFRPKVGVVCQTTQKQENLNRVVGVVLPLIKELKLYNTICNATVQRQSEAYELAEKSDILLVVGGKNSANTRKLAEIGTSMIPTYHIESIEEINPHWFRGKEIIGVTAGASTPQVQISEVVNWLKANLQEV
jgi:4-hydroxy-3-methylbut-2-enyl diphosphate reductase